jgi:tRNA(Met) cytidine acetyltransferase
MALYPLSSAGHELVLRESQRLARDEFWLREWREALFPQPEAPAAMLTDDDWLDVAGFAFAHRPLPAVVGSLNRLLLHTGLPLPALRARLQRQDEAEICTGLGLSGRKALLAGCAKKRDWRCWTWTHRGRRGCASRSGNCNFFN